ncbi:hypothetical protein BK816_04920 [Boudabousia tangfeifanii]|uniref:HhH-GPD domain-containing protein n=1 Tax=Boudabousia tangfeifanii TaxID=1912795 RepID=A0A1D9MK89_9ACTO|nr:hypothetical protein [Boudabousia tangfeifanii]AOZ72715.1 hypothetical protein BK816_04920 [Boudabousia tangfeifanii]
MEGIMFRDIYQELGTVVSLSKWWPADHPFAIGVGAVLTQNTSWVNVEKAIRGLQLAGLSSPEQILHADPKDLMAVIRPAGFMRAKSSYLQNWAEWWLYDHKQAEQVETSRLRKSLLSMPGIGPETADVILLYIYSRPVFIWDKYARRLMVALGYEMPTTYEKARSKYGQSEELKTFSVDELERFHGLIVDGAKQAKLVGGWEYFLPSLKADSNQRDISFSKRV